MLEGRIHRCLVWLVLSAFVCMKPFHANAQGLGAQKSKSVVIPSSKLVKQPAMQGVIIDSSRTFAASLDSPGAIHRYRIKLPRDSIFSATVSATDGTLYPMLRLRRPDQVLLKNPVAYNKRSAQLGLYKLTSGQAILEVFAQGGRRGSYLIDVRILDRDRIKNQIVELTNIARKNAGLEPLVRDSLLDMAADAHVQDMDQQDAYLAHVGSQGSTPEQRIKSVGYKAAWVKLKGNRRRTIRLENAATGWSTAAEVVEAWLASPGHQAAIMDPEAREIGVGFEYDNENSTTYWIQTFGVPWRPGLMQWF